MSDLALSCKNLSRTFNLGKIKVNVLADVSIEIKKSQRVAILGSSGSGKSTLLHLLGGLDKPDGGSIHIIGTDILGLSEAKLSAFRNQHIGFVYQFHHLLPEFNALENVCMPLWLLGIDKQESHERAQEILQKSGLGERLLHRPAELSGGERQRVAIARAMVTKPALIMADEPTGNLDGQTAMRVFELLNKLNQEIGTAMLIVTHDKKIAANMDRILTLENKSIRE